MRERTALPGLRRASLRKNRHMLLRSLVVIGAVLMAVNQPGHAQVVEYRGTATNLGTDTHPTPPLTGSLSIRIDSTSNGSMVIGAPLGGSGGIVSRRWADTLVIFSLGQAGDTIIWLGKLDGNRLAGFYRVVRGAARGQGGQWAVARTPGARLPELLPLTDALAQDRIGELVLPARERGSQVPVERWYPGSRPSPPQDREEERQGLLFLVLIFGAWLMVREWWRYPKEPTPGASRHERQAPAPQTPPDGLAAARLLLGVPEHASLVEIRRAWRAQMLRHHPDLAGMDEARRCVMHRRAQELNLAYAALTKGYRQPRA